MATATANGVTTTYVYNGLGERVEKSNAQATRYFAYDEAGHLLGEYDGTGGLVQETVWFGDIPVATLRPDGSGGIEVYYVHTDHLKTPRRVSRPSDGAIVWQWQSTPFGSDETNEDPDGDQTEFTYNLRFPGQYYDAESGLTYNYFRYYDSRTGRYVESDPIGLRAGPNTYGYASGNPLLFVDPFGLTIYRFPGNYYTDTPNSIAEGTGCQTPIWIGQYIVGWAPCQSEEQYLEPDCPPTNGARRNIPGKSGQEVVPRDDQPSPQEKFQAVPSGFSSPSDHFKACIAEKANVAAMEVAPVVGAELASIYVFHKLGYSKPILASAGSAYATGDTLLALGHLAGSWQICRNELEREYGP